MAPIRRSVTGNAAGYTLVELLVVLAIIGLVVVATPALWRVALPNARSLAASRELAQELRAERGQAVATSGRTAVRFDVATQTYFLEPGDVARHLPDGVRFALPQDTNASVIEIAFRADGSSSGGAVFVGEGANRHRVSTDWLTGRVSIDE
jgi:general secretion pathway protein H